jgi:hypothetical protein
MGLVSLRMLSGQRRELQRLVALDAVPGVSKHHDLRLRPAARPFVDIGVVDDGESAPRASVSGVGLRSIASRQRVETRDDATVVALATAAAASQRHRRRDVSSPRCA